jgi:hypothetical protein
VFRLAHWNGTPVLVTGARAGLVVTITRPDQLRSAICRCADMPQAGVVETAPVLRSTVKAFMSPAHDPAL